MTRVSMLAAAVLLVAVTVSLSRAPATHVAPASEGLSIAEIQAAAGTLSEAEFQDHSFAF